MKIIKTSINLKRTTVTSAIGYELLYDTGFKYDSGMVYDEWMPQGITKNQGEKGIINKIGSMC